jgi:hypothetical protein
VEAENSSDVMTVSGVWYIVCVCVCWEVGGGGRRRVIGEGERDKSLDVVRNCLCHASVSCFTKFCFKTRLMVESFTVEQNSTEGLDIMENAFKR